MNPWSHQRQREKALQKYYDQLNPQPKKQENSAMAYDPYEAEHRFRKEQEYLIAKQQQIAQANASYLYPSYYPAELKEESIEKSSSTECVVGLRVWKIVDDKGLPKLASVVKNSVLWPYRKPLERDPIMAEGIHAIKPGDRVISLFNEYGAHVAGEVYLWGTVIEHSGGYLADFAYPKKLLVPADFDVVKAMQLEDEYGVPCEYREEFKKASGPKTATAMSALNPYVYPAGILGRYSPAGF